MSANNSQIVRSVPLTAAATHFNPAANGRSMGVILVDAGRISSANTERVMVYQRQNGGIDFGEAGKALGLLTDDDVRFALAVQFDYSYVPEESNLSHELVAAYQPDSPVAEQLRMLRSQLMLRWFDNRAEQKGLAVVSASAAEGRSYIAANMAIVFSQLGERTLLIDADLRTPRQHKIFSLGHKAGLSDMLVGLAGADAVTAIGALPNLSVLPAGTIPPNPQELLGRQNFAKLLQSLGHDFDVMIIDTPAASVCADAQTIAVRAGAALIVARQDKSSMAQLARLTRSLRDFGVTLVGSVLNDS